MGLRQRSAVCWQAVEEAFDELLDFVSGRNAATAMALESRWEALLGFHRLDVPATLDQRAINLPTASRHRF